MRIALMHYHLRPGGVTTVIREQLRALSRRCDCMVLSGELPHEGEEPDLAAAVRVVPGLGYDESGCGSPDPRGTAAAVRAAMIQEWGSEADVLHVHNALLNKNSSLLSILGILHEAGIALFLQIHDLAEDGRPTAYNRSGEYPRDCHYGVGNSRDQQALLTSGLLPQGLHLLFNAVRPIEGGSIADLPPRERGAPRPRLLYPVRAIRRKNIGEALLLGLLLDADISVTLPPQNPADRLLYDGWKSFARSRGMSAEFEVGLARSLEQMMGESTGAVTTSVKEGFGFSFLEPWTTGRAVVGRRIDAVCKDFEKEGLRLPQLYSSLAVPVALFDAPDFHA
ncbi:MAG: glycosyltransferase family 1 protein, partial [Spirochaetes bacterium]|nr:glycosyltransferase family 1 protein [Spirochaetota bacterium]